MGETIYDFFDRIHEEVANVMDEFCFDLSEKEWRRLYRIAERIQSSIEDIEDEVLY